MSELIITIDGPAGAGKSTNGIVLAEQLNYSFVESGLIYRGITTMMLRNGLTPDSSKKSMQRVLSSIDLEVRNNQVFAGCVDITDKVMELTISRITPSFNALPWIREAAMCKLRTMVSDEAVVVGRDIGSVVFASAGVKFYLDADVSVRAERCYKALAKQGVVIDFETVLADIARRDEQDKTRDVAPLVRPLEAVFIDTTKLQPEQVVAQMLDRVRVVIE